METKNDIYAQLGPLGIMFKFMDDHKTLANVILAIEILALVWAVFTYEFTIPAYK